MKRRDAGFTLIEMVIAVAVAVLLVGGVYSAVVSSARTAERQAMDARKESVRALAIEIIKADLRGRAKVKAEPLKGGQGTVVTLLGTTADGLAFGDPPRSVPEIRYIVSEQGLKCSSGKKENGVGMTLLEGPVRMEFWTAGAWRTIPIGEPSAVRVLVSDPIEIIVVR